MSSRLAPSACALPVTVVRPPDGGPSLYHCHVHGWTGSPDGERCGRLADLNDAEPAEPGRCDACGSELPGQPLRVVAGITGFYGVGCSRGCADKLRMQGRDDYGMPLYVPVPGLPEGHRYCERTKTVVKMEDACCARA